MPATEDPEKKGRALELVLDAWDTALAEGADPEVIASVAIYAALAEKDQTKWHAPGLFDKITGEIKKSSSEKPVAPKYQDVF